MKFKQFHKFGRWGARGWPVALMTAAILLSAVHPVAAAAPAAEGGTEPVPVSAPASASVSASIPANACLSTLEKRLKAGGQLAADAVLTDADEPIPVLVVLRQPANAGAAEPVSASADALADRMASAWAQQRAFLAEAEAAVGHALEAEPVLLALGNVLAMSLNGPDLSRIAALEPVARISPNSAVIAAPEAIRVTRSGRSARRARSAYDPDALRGRGELIAVIDTGFDIDHVDFQMAPAEGDRYADAAAVEARVAALNAAAGTPILKGRWLNHKFPYGYNFANNTDDVRETGNSHGTHVAAIAAASNHYRGQAPEAQLLAMRVLAGESDDAAPGQYAKAIEHSVLLGATSINMSFGVPAATLKQVGEEILHAIGAARAAGALINVSTGNENYTDSDLQPPRTDQPNYGMVSAPAVAPDVLAVASIDSDSVNLPYLEYNGEKRPYYPCNDQPVTAVCDEAIELRAVGRATEAELADLPADALKGKAALIERGVNRFDEKVAAVAARGARLALIYDHEDSGEWVNMGIHDPAIPAVFLRRSDGLALLGQVSPVVLRRALAAFRLDGAGQLSYFSSWGPTPEFDLKPEITAVGGHVYAAQPGNTHADKSGTSMASPQVAGVTALLQERLKKDADLAVPDYDPDQSADHSARYLFLKNMLMSTALPHIQHAGDPFASPRKQGAGILNKDGALRSYAFVTAQPAGGKPAVSKINLGTAGTAFELALTVHNVSRTKTLQFKAAQTTVQTDRLDPKNPRLIIPVGAQRICPDLVQDAVITVGPGQTVDVRIPVDIAARDAELSRHFANGYFVEGFVRLVSQTEGQCDIGLPYIGFRHVAGDGSATAYYDLPVLEKAIYDYADLSDTSNDVPKYYRMPDAAEEHPFTALMSESGGRPVVLGEVGEPGAAVRQFDRNRIAFSPNADGACDTVGLRGCFLAHYRQDRVVIQNDGGETVYEGPVGYSGEADAQGNIQIGRKNAATAGDGSAGQRYSELEAYVWNGRDTGGSDCPDGQYRYIFEVRGVADPARLQQYVFPVCLDRTPPALSNVRYADGRLSADVSEAGSGIRRAELERYSASGERLSSDLLPVSDVSLECSCDAAELDSRYLRLADHAGNVYWASLRAVVSGGQTGSAEAVWTDADGQPIADLKPDAVQLAITDAAGRVQMNPKQLPFGEYKAVLNLKTLDYTVEEPEQSFEIDAANRTARLIYRLKRQPRLKVRLPLLSATANGYLPNNVDRPFIRLTNGAGISVSSKAQNQLGRGSAFEPLLTPGEWTVEAERTAEGWALLPEKTVITVDETGQVEAREGVLSLLYVGPALRRLTPQCDLKTDRITAEAVRFEVLYDARDQAGHVWHRRQMTDWSKLPPAHYQVRPVLPDGFYAVPERLSADLTEGDAGPTFEIHEKTADDYGRVTVQTRLDGVPDDSADVTYVAVNPDGVEFPNLSHLPYGTWVIRPRHMLSDCYPETETQTVELGPGSKTAVVTFNWIRLTGSGKTGTLAIWANWNYQYADMYAFAALMDGRPYRFVLKPLDDPDRPPLSFAMANTWERMALADIPYGRYELTADLSGTPGFYVDRPSIQVRIDRPRTTLDLQYGKTAYPEPEAQVLESEGIRVTIPVTSRLAGQALRLTVRRWDAVPDPVSEAASSLPPGQRIIYEVHLENPAGEPVPVPVGERLELLLSPGGLNPQTAELYYLPEGAAAARRMACEPVETGGEAKIKTVVSHFSYYALVAPQVSDPVYDIQIEPAEGAEIATDPAGQAPAGRQVIVHVRVTDPEKELDKIVIDGVEQDAATFAMPAKAVTVGVKLKARPQVPDPVYDIQIEPAEGAEIATDPAGQAPAGRQVTVHVRVTDPEKELDKIVIDGVEQDAATFVMPAQAVTVSVKLRARPPLHGPDYDIRIEPSEGAEITTDPADRAPAGRQVTVHVRVTDPEKELDKIVIDGVEQDAAAFVMPAQAVTVSVKLRARPPVPKPAYGIRIESVEGAEITTEPAGQAPAGRQVIVHVRVTDPEKELDKIVIDGVEQDAATFVMPVQAVTVGVKLRDRPKPPQPTDPLRPIETAPDESETPVPTDTTEPTDPEDPTRPPDPGQPTDPGDSTGPIRPTEADPADSEPSVPSPDHPARTRSTGPIPATGGDSECLAGGRGGKPAGPDGARTTGSIPRAGESPLTVIPLLGALAVLLIALWYRRRRWYRD